MVRQAHHDGVISSLSKDDAQAGIGAHEMQPHPRAILIAGPTASGKSALALALAEALNGTVINADALQVYEELWILTARPDPKALARAPHALYGHISARQSYSVARWLEDARAAIREARAHGRVPILVGGTGLYFRAVLEGLAELPPIPSEIRANGNALFEAEGAQAFRARLAAVDREAAERLPLNDRYRAVRAYEVAVATGRTLAEWQRGAHSPLLAEEDTLCLALVPDRRRLNAAIDARFRTMIETGALAEVIAVSALGLGPRQPALKSLGLAELAAYLAGKLELSEAIAAAQQRTRRYAKRQLTWIRGQMMSWTVLDQQELDELTCNHGISLLKMIDPPPVPT
jgi:tRNA dimethylallyltransferase